MKERGGEGKKGRKEVYENFYLKHSHLQPFHVCISKDKETEWRLKYKEKNGLIDLFIYNTWFRVGDKHECKR